MIAMPKRRKSRITPDHQQLFVTMLPTITRVARQSFSGLDAEAKEEAVAEVIAMSYMMFVSLVHRGREALAYPSVLAMYGVKRAKIGRMAATPQNVRDVSSLYCRLKNGAQLERLDRFNRQDETWKEVIVEDRHSSPADIAAARIDVSDWLESLPKRDRRVAETLATGESTTATAKMFNVSKGRVSQLRRELQQSWQEFVGEK